MLATKEDVLAVAPESTFATLTQPQWDAAFALVSPFQNDSVWGSDARAKQAGALFVAHHLALMYPSKAGAGGLTVTSKSVGGISVSYASPSVDKDALAMTRWGIILLRMRRSLLSGMRVV
jgi:hypothetical protein